MAAADAERLHLEVTEVLEAYATCHLLASAAVAHPLAEPPRLLAPPRLVCAAPYDQWQGVVADAASLVPRGLALALTVPLHERVAVTAQFLDGSG